MIKKLLFLTSVVAVVALTAFFSFGCSSLPENAAASVNGVVISKDDVANRIRVMTGLSPGSIPSDTESDDYKNVQRDVTEQLVNEEVEKQEADKRNITVSDDEVSTAIDQVVEDKFFGDPSKLEAGFAQRNVTVDDLRGDIRRRFIHQKMLASLKDEVPVSEDEIRAAYESGISNYVHPERRQVRQLVVADEANARQIATGLANGEDFSALASQVSIDQKTKKNGGFVGMVTQNDLPAAVGQTAFSLSVNQISMPVKSDLGWYIIKVDIVQPPLNRSFDEVKPELSVFIGNQKASEHYKEYTAQIHDQYDVQFADDYSPRTDDGTSSTATATTDTTQP